MKPIHALLVHKSDWYRGEERIDGFFQYPVPEFTWDHLEVKKGFHLDLHQHQYRKYDIIFWDDGKYKDYAGFSPLAPHTTYMVPQVCMYALYPTLTNSHFTRRVARAKKNADIVLIDHDDVERWKEATKLRCFRMAYCTNERYYVPGAKDIDVGFYYVLGWNKERVAMDKWLKGFCHKKGWSYHSTNGKSVGRNYRDLLSRTRVVIHMNRTMNTRPPRIFDASISGCAMLSNPMPVVSEENWDGKHVSFQWPRSEEYKQFTRKEVPTYTDRDCGQVAQGLERLIDKHHYREIVLRAREYTLQFHTWAVRAGQLREVICAAFPKIAAKVQ